MGGKEKERDKRERHIEYAKMTRNREMEDI